MLKLTLVGLGSVGASIGLALKAVSTDIDITAHEPDPVRLKRGQALGAFDRSHWNLLTACDGADLVVLDLPMEQMELTLAALNGELGAGAVVVDTLALKAPVMALAARVAPETAFVGGHVVAPRLLGGAEPFAEALQGALFYLVAPPHAGAGALERAATLAEAVGARPLFVDAAEHDAVAAATAALPVVGAAALVALLRREEGWPDRAQAVGGELAALAVLLAGVDPAWADLAAANRDELLRWLALYRAELERWGALVAADDTAGLRTAVAAAADTAGEWARGPHEEEQAPAPAGDWRQLLLGRFGHLFDKRS